MKDEITNQGLTVGEAKAKTFVELVGEGKKPAEAAREVGATLNSLRKTGALAKACRDLLERVEQEKLLEKKTRESIARARLLELMIQDDDLKVALAAARTELEAGRPGVAVQINNNLLTDPGVVESLKTLQLEVEDENQGTQK